MKTNLRSFIQGLYIGAGFFISLLVLNFVFSLALWLITLVRYYDLFAK